MKLFLVSGVAVAAVLLGPAAALAAPSPEDAAFIFNTLSFLANGALVFAMAIGFCMLEAGMVRSKSTSAICVKNIGLFSIAGVTYAIVGYNLMYNGVDGGFIGSLGLFDTPDPASEASDGGYAAASDWFFQVVFVATTASIVSGSVAERVRVLPFVLVIAVLVAVIYPIQGAWSWGRRLAERIGLLRFRRLYDRALRWRLVRAGRDHPARRTAGEVRGRRQGQSDAGIGRSVGGARHFRAVDRVAGLQRRFAAGLGVG